MFLLALLAWPLVHFAASTTVQSNVCRDPTAPTIVQPLDGSTTKTSPLLVSGTSLDANFTITILDNGRADGSTTSDASGNFAVTVPLVSGQNQLVARASNPCNATADSPAVTVDYQPPPPPLPTNTQPQQPGTSPSTPTSANSPTTTPSAAPTTTSPPSKAHKVQKQTSTTGPLTLTVNGSKQFGTTHPSVFVNGTTSLPAAITISVNGQNVARLNTGASGYFDVLVPLDLGNNRIVISATAGKATTSVDLDITRTQATTQSFWSSRGGKLVIVTAVAVPVAGVVFVGAKLAFAGRLLR